MVGLGGTPIGSSPFGMGTPIAAAAPPEQALQAARYIDPVTRDYVAGDDGEYLAMPSVRQRALIALGTTLGSSSALLEAGLKLPDRIDQRYPQTSEQSIRAALDFMVRAGEMHIDGVRVEDSGAIGRSQHLIDYVDLTTGNTGTLTL